MAAIMKLNLNYLMVSFLEGYIAGMEFRRRELCDEIEYIDLSVSIAMQNLSSARKNRFMVISGKKPDKES